MNEEFDTVHVRLASHVRVCKPRRVNTIIYYVFIRTFKRVCLIERLSSCLILLCGDMSVCASMCMAMKTCMWVLMYTLHVTASEECLGWLCANACECLHACMSKGAWLHANVRACIDLCIMLGTPTSCLRARRASGSCSKHRPQRYPQRYNTNPVYHHLSDVIWKRDCLSSFKLSRTDALPMPLLEPLPFTGLEALIMDFRYG